MDCKMDKGKIAQIGTPAEIYDNPVNPYVASFIGEMNFLEKDEHTIAFRPEEIKIHKKIEDEIIQQLNGTQHLK